MAAIRLRPLFRLSNAVAPRPKVFCSYSGFSTISFHQLGHLQPATTPTRYLPRFLDPNVYWNPPKSRSKAKRHQEKKPWNPATFYIVIFVLMGSQAIQMIALRLNHDERIRQANTKIAILKEVVNRLHSGEDVDVEGMLGVGNEKDEKNWEEILNEIEEEDEIWKAKTRKKRLPTSENNTSTESDPTGRLEAEKQTTPKFRKAQSARDYGFS